jgi:hypothetical protein
LAIDSWRLPYFGGVGVNISRLRPGSGFGLGLGAFLVSFLPLSLLPMRPSMTQNAGPRKEPIAPNCCLLGLLLLRRCRLVREMVVVQDRVEYQAVGSQRFAAIDGVVAEEQNIALTEMRIHDHGMLRN